MKAVACVKSLLADLVAQHELLEGVADLIEVGRLRTTLGEHFGRMDAANLRRAHAFVESGAARGKVVLEGFYRFTRKVPWTSCSPRSRPASSRWPTAS